MGRNSLIKVTVAVAALMLTVSACKKDEPAPPPPPAQPKPAPPKPVQGQQSSVRADNGGKQFDFSGKKDPFKAFIAAPKPQPQGPSPIPGLSSGLPIQSYELSQFRVIGLIAGLRENKGMVVDPTGKAYVIREGMIIGKYHGKITKITSQYAEVVEQYQDDNGKIKKRVVRLTLPKKD